MKLGVLLNQKEILMHLGMLEDAEKCCQAAFETASIAQDDEKKWNILQTLAELRLRQEDSSEAYKVMKLPPNSCHCSLLTTNFDLGCQTNGGSG